MFLAFKIIQVCADYKKPRGITTIMKGIISKTVFFIIRNKNLTISENKERY